MIYSEVTSSRSYLSFDRMTSYYQQFAMVLDALELIDGDDLSVLEVGGSNGFLKAFLTNYFRIHALRHKVISLDLDDSARPDINGDVRAIPLEDKSVDVSACFEVLEHVPSDDFTMALEELERVTRRYVLVSLPHKTIYLSLIASCTKSAAKHILLAFFDPGFLRFHGPDRFGHFWEIGFRDYSLRETRLRIASTGLDIIEEFRNPLMPEHHFFFLKVG